MSRHCATLAFLAIVAIPASAFGQERFTIEGSVGVALPTQDLADASLQTGLGFGGAIGYFFMPHLAAYAGWDWHHFNASQSFAGTDMDFETTGYTFGLRFQHPLGGEQGKVAIRLRGGGLLNHVEVEDVDGDLVVDTGHGLGWEVGAGLAVSAGKWEIIPAARLRSLKRDFEVGTTTTTGTLSYLALEIGFARRF
jgi:hypothetical protein